MSEELRRILGKWLNSLKSANLGGVRSFTATVIADRISEIAIHTKTGTPEMPLRLRSLYLDARERREKELKAQKRDEEIELPFMVNTLIEALSSALEPSRRMSDATV